MIAQKVTWNKVEQEAWKVRETMRPSEWAEQYRILHRSNIPGPYRNENAPYLRGMMDIAVVPGVEQVNIQKGAQLGVSEAARNLIGYFADQEPDPVGLTLPDRMKGRKIVRLDILPLFTRTPILVEMIGSLARDASTEMINLTNGFLLELMWSGSATSTASNPYRRVFNDEVDKFEPWAGDEPDPVGRTWKRMRTYGERRLQVNISTPTTTDGSIFKLVQSSSYTLYFYVPCPYCQKYQRLVFPQLKWKKLEATTKAKLADMIVQSKAVWYECFYCQKKIKEKHKSAMVNAGYWSTEEGYVEDYWGKKYANAENVRRWSIGTRIGFQISALYCLWEKWTDVVAEFLRAEGYLDRSFNFRTETLGEPFEFQVARLRSGVFSEKTKRARLDVGIVPSWAWSIITTIDTQQDHFYVVVRAWGSGMKSQRIYHAILPDFNALDNLIYGTKWTVEGNKYPSMLTALALIDSGGTEDKMLGMTRTMQVYNWVLPRQAVVRAIKGASRPSDNLYWPMKNPIPKSKKDKSNQNIELDLRAYMFDSHRAKDILADMIVRGIPKKVGRSTGEPDQEEIWMLNTQSDPVYDTQMSAMHRTAERKGKQVVDKWKLVQSGARRDYHDCETFQIVAAYMYNIHVLPPEEELMARKETERMDAIRMKTAKKKEAENERGRGPKNKWEVTPFETISY